MLHIILTILKIIGILLLVILALLLVCTGVILFVPVRYRATGKKDADGYFVKAQLYWLLHLLRVKAVFPEPGSVVVKLLCFTIYDSKAEPKPEKEKKVKKEPKPEKEKKPKKRKQEKDEETSTASQSIAVQRAAEQQTTETETKKTETAEAETRETPESNESTKKGGILHIFAKIKAVFKRIFEILKNIKYTICRLYDKIKEIWANLRYYVEVLKEEETIAAFEMCKSQLYKVWKNIRPKKCRAQLLVGTGEPDTTGYILALHGMLYPLLGDTVTIQPDFESKVLEGNFFFKGRITLFVLVYVALKIYFDNNVRYFLKRFKREE